MVSTSTTYYENIVLGLYGWDKLITGHGAFYFPEDQEATGEEPEEIFIGDASEQRNEEILGAAYTQLGPHDEAQARNVELAS